MSYGNQYQGQFQGPYNQGYYSPYQNQGNRGRQQYYSNPKPKKRSGAILKTYHNANGQEQYLTMGWRLTRNKEMITYKCYTTKKTETTQKGWLTHIWVEILNNDTGMTSTQWGVMQKSTGKVVIDKLRMVINPRANNGGYTGTYIRK